MPHCTSSLIASIWQWNRVYFYLFLAKCKAVMYFNEWDSHGCQSPYFPPRKINFFLEKCPPKGRFTHSMPCPCRTHAVPLPCRAAKDLECLPHLIYTVRPCLIHTCHLMLMPCSDHTVLIKVTAQHGRRETACGLPARVRLLPATTRSSTKIVITSIPILLTTIHTYECKEW
jgi:hypothetical protein